MSNIVADIVDDDGFIATYEMGGGFVDRDNICIRPAMWIRLNAGERAESAKQQNSGDLPVLRVPEFRASRLTSSETSFLGTEFLRGQIMTITFQDSLDGAPADAVDVSEQDDGSILLWASECEGPDSDDRTFDTYYNLIIAGDGGIRCPESLSNMFANCESLTAIEFGDCFDTSCVTDTSWMFWGCVSASEIDVSSFDTTNVTDMSFMFCGCESVPELNLKNFDTSHVERIAEMFEGCKSLQSLDPSNFDIHGVTDLYYMFAGCSSLTTLDLSSFDTSNVVGMNDMFYGCSALTALNLSSFDTSQVVDMGYMFRVCSSLTLLDLSNFDTSNAAVMWGMFSGCSALTDLDTSGFVIGENADTTGMYDGVPGYGS